MRIYYSHTKKIFETPREQREISFIEHMFPGVVIFNPLKHLQYDLFEEFNRSEEITKSWAIICSRYDGYFTKGVYEDVKCGMDMKKPVWLILQPGKLIRIKNLQIVNPSIWDQYGRALYG